MDGIQSYLSFALRFVQCGGIRIGDVLVAVIEISQQAPGKTSAATLFVNEFGEHMLRDEGAMREVCDLGIANGAASGLAVDILSCLVAANTAAAAAVYSALCKLASGVRGAHALRSSSLGGVIASLEGQGLQFVSPAAGLHAASPPAAFGMALQPQSCACACRLPGVTRTSAASFRSPMPSELLPPHLATSPERRVSAEEMAGTASLVQSLRESAAPDNGATPASPLHVREYPHGTKAAETGVQTEEDLTSRGSQTKPPIHADDITGMRCEICGQLSESCVVLQTANDAHEARNALLRSRIEELQAANASLMVELEKTLTDMAQSQLRASASRLGLRAEGSGGVKDEVSVDVDAMLCEADRVLAEAQNLSGDGTIEMPDLPPPDHEIIADP